MAKHLCVDPESIQLNSTDKLAGVGRINKRHNPLLQHRMGLPKEYPAMRNQKLTETLFNKEFGRPQKISFTTEVTYAKADSTSDQSSNSTDEIIYAEADSSGTPRSNSMEKSAVDLPKRQTRLVQFPRFYTRREELMQSNKPYYQYVPTILTIWQESDYIKHNYIYQKQVSNEERQELSLDITQLIKDRAITFKPLISALLKRNMEPVQRQDRWWIVADTKVLLDDMQFIDKLIKSDPTCRMRLPYEVLHDLTAMSTKQQKPWMRIPARRVVQYLETAIDRDRSIIAQSMVQNEDLLDSTVATDAVLNCCLQLAKLYYYVVVITDDEERRKRAASVGLPAFPLGLVKALVTQAFMFNNSVKLNINVTRTFVEGY